MKLKNIFLISSLFTLHSSLLFAGWADHIVISEVATGSTASAYDEFVELYNPTASEIDIGDWKVEYSAAANENFAVNLANIPTGTKLPAFRYYLVANNGATKGPGYTTGNADQLKDWNWGLSASGGHVRILNAASVEQDRLGWGTAAFPEGTADAGQGGDNDKSMERKAFSSSTQASMEGGADDLMGNGEDSNDNSADFIVRTSRDPQSKSDGTVEPEAPPAPESVTATDLNNDGTLEITWAAAAYDTGVYDYFNIYKGTSSESIGQGDFSGIYNYTSDSATLHYWDGKHGSDEVKENVTYYYKISAVSTGARNNESPKSDFDSAFSIDKVAPAVPTGLSALDTGNGNEIFLTWTPSSSDDVYIYKIGSKNAYFPTFETFGVVTSTISAWSGSEKSSWTIFSTQTDGTTYFFRLMAIDRNSNESVLSSTASAYSTDTTAPENVSVNNIANEGSGTALNLYWTSYSPSADVAGYKIWYDTADFGVTVSTDLWGSVTGKDNKIQKVTGLAEGTTYWFAVTAYDEVPNEKTNVSGYTVSLYPTNAPPQKLTMLSALNEGTGKKINLSWTASIESDVTGYNLYQARFSSITETNYEYKYSVSTPTAARVMTGLANFSTYYFAVSALDATHEGVISSTVSAIPSDITPPGVVTVISIASLSPPTSGQALVLDWTNPSDSDFRAAVLYRSTFSASYGGPVPLTQLTDGGTFYHDTGLTNGTTYYYTFHTLDYSGNESTVNVQGQGRPLDSFPPSAVQNFTSRDNGVGGKVNLSWTANTESDLRGYNIYRDSAAVSLLAGGTFYVDTASAGATYFYQIAAQDFSDNVSSFSSVLTFVKDVSVLPPTGISLSVPYSGRRIKLTWNNPADLKGVWIYRNTVSDTATVFGVDPSTKLAASCTYYTDTGLTDGATYYYGIKTVNYLYQDTVFKSTNTKLYSMFPYDVLKPSAVANVSLKLTFTTGNPPSKDILITWDKVTKNEDGSACDDLTGYEVWWKSEGSNWGDNDPIRIGSPDTVQYTHKGLAENTFYYKIRAFDDASPPNYSEFSSTASKFCLPVLSYSVLSDSVAATSFTPNGDGIADSLEVCFTLNESSKMVSVEVMLSTGGTIVVSSATYSRGTHSVVWSPSNLPDGVYIVSIIIDGNPYSSSQVSVRGYMQAAPAANNYPNPFIMSRDGYTKIRFRLSTPGSVKIAVYNVLGELVKTWKISQNELAANYRNQISPQWYEIPWDGRNGIGVKVASGIYICRITGPGISENVKIAVVR